MNELALRYGSSLLSIANETNCLDSYQEEVKALIEILENNEKLLTILNSSFIHLDERLKIIDDVFKDVSKPIQSLLKIVVKNNRSLYLIDILKGFNSLANNQKGIQEGIVYSTEKLSKDLLRKITDSVSKKEKKTIELVNLINPSLIGGIKVVINDHIYDGSIKYHIYKLKNDLLKKGGNTR